MGGVFAINPDGTLKWHFINIDQTDVFPTVAIGDDGTLYFGTGILGFFALNPDGTEKWNFMTGQHIESSTAIGSDGTIYFGSWDNYFYALNPDGTEKWKFKTAGEGIVSTPGIGSDGTVYIVANDKHIYAFSPGGTLKWKFFLDGGKELPSSPAIGADGTIYVASSWSDGQKDTFFAINPDGTIKWSYNIGSAGPSPAIGADGTVYIASYNYNIYAFGGPGEEQEEKEGVTPKEFIEEEPAPRERVDEIIYVWNPKEEEAKEGSALEPSVEGQEGEPLQTEPAVSFFHKFINLIITFFKKLFGLFEF